MRKNRELSVQRGHQDSFSCPQQNMSIHPESSRMRTDGIAPLFVAEHHRLSER